jgi:hypothetical protein
MADLEQRELESARRAHVKRAARLGLALQEAGEKKLPTLCRNLQTSRDIVQTIRTGVELEKNALGLSHKDGDDNRPPVVSQFGILDTIRLQVTEARKQLLASLGLVGNGVIDAPKVVSAIVSHDGTCRTMAALSAPSNDTALSIPLADPAKQEQPFLNFEKET